MTAAVPPPRRSLLLPVILCLAALAVLLGLGTWQLERKAWKEALIETLNQRLGAPPQPLPHADDWPSLNAANDEFRRVTFRAAPLKSDDPRKAEARVYASGSGLRDDVKGPGYFVFAPARLPDGRVVIVNRGFVSGQPGADTKPAPQPDEAIEIVGVLRWPEQAGWFVPAYSTRDDLWHARSVPDMIARKEWGAAAPFYVDQEAPVPSGGVPRPAPLRLNLPNNHLQYALTWYGLAAVLVVIFAVFVRSRRKSA